MNITLDLTSDEIDTLKDALDSYCDEGPCWDGHRSESLIELSKKVELQLNEQQRVSGQSILPKPVANPAIELATSLKSPQ